MLFPLTKDGDAFISVLYKEYCQRRKDGKSIEESAYMGNDDVIQRDLVPKLKLEDVTHLSWYLHEKGLLDVRPGDDKANDVSLSDDGVAYMQDEYPKGLPDIVKHLKDLIPFVAWLTGLILSS